MLGELGCVEYLGKLLKAIDTFVYKMGNRLFGMVNNGEHC